MAALVNDNGAAPLTSLRTRFRGANPPPPDPPAGMPFWTPFLMPGPQKSTPTTVKTPQNRLLGGVFGPFDKKGSFMWGAYQKGGSNKAHPERGSYGGNSCHRVGRNPPNRLQTIRTFYDMGHHNLLLAGCDPVCNLYKADSLKFKNRYTIIRRKVRL